MPIGSAPPNPWKDPKAYILWTYDQLESIAIGSAGDGLAKLLESQIDTVAKLRLEPPESETPES